jgi:hypothetical protein
MKFKENQIYFIIALSRELQKRGIQVIDHLTDDEDGEIMLAGFVEGKLNQWSIYPDDILVHHNGIDNAKEYNLSEWWKEKDKHLPAAAPMYSEELFKGFDEWADDGDWCYENRKLHWYRNRGEKNEILEIKTTSDLLSDYLASLKK